MEPAPQYYEEISNIRRELKRMREDIRSEIHLATAEAETEWSHLELEARRLEARLVAHRDRANTATKQRAAELRRRLRAFVDQHLRRRRSA